MAEIPSLVPLHCAFCLKHLPVDGAPTVACARCSTPYCSADCRAKDKTEGCRLRWNEATFDEETGDGLAFVQMADGADDQVVFANGLNQVVVVDDYGNLFRQEKGPRRHTYP